MSSNRKPPGWMVRDCGTAWGIYPPGKFKPLMRVLREGLDNGKAEAERICRQMNAGDAATAAVDYTIHVLVKIVAEPRSAALESEVHAALRKLKAAWKLMEAT